MARRQDLTATDLVLFVLAARWGARREERRIRLTREEWARQRGEVGW